MKFFAYNENLDEQMTYVQRRIKKLMNGEIASQLAVAGINYPKLFGVSLVHLRQLSQEVKVSNELADRLWHRNIRETMILATMAVQRDSISDEQLMDWAEGLNNLELAEQMAFNLLEENQLRSNYRKVDAACSVLCPVCCPYGAGLAVSL